jgi:hypothetical protein
MFMSVGQGGVLLLLLLPLSLLPLLLLLLLLPGGPGGICVFKVTEQKLGLAQNKLK